MISPAPDRTLAACFAASTEAGVSESLQSAIDWEKLIRCAATELLLPGLYRRLNDSGVKIPSDAADFLAAVEELNRERNERILDEAREIAKVLNAIDIEPVFLKGAAFLLERVYPSAGCRYLCDLDLLVPESRLAEAAEALEREGYRPDASDHMARFRHHYPQLQRPRSGNDPGSGPVELHHSLGQGVCRGILSGEEVLRASRVLEWRGVRIRVPSPEHLISHLVLHSQIHHTYSERIWPPLRAMQDLVMLERRFGSQLDWQAIRERFRAHGEDTTLILHLLQVNRTLGMPMPFAAELGWTARARWRRRRALNAWPALRFIDPTYVVLSTLSRRLRFLKSVLSHSAGREQALHTILQRGFYRRLLAEISLR